MTMKLDEGYAVMMHRCRHGLTVKIFLVHQIEAMADDGGFGFSNIGGGEPLYGGQLGRYDEEARTGVYCPDTVYSHYVWGSIERLRACLTENYAEFMRLSVEQGATEDDCQARAAALVASVMIDVELERSLV